MNEDEKFFAWLDGELEPAEAAEMAAKVAADPELMRLADRHRALASQLRGAFDPIIAEPIPERLKIRPSAEVVDLAARRRRSMPSLPQWAAIAATLVAGVLVGTIIPVHGSGPVRVQEGRLYAAASLDEGLDTALASAPAGPVRIGLTFRGHAGEICRTFTIKAASGLACREGSRWRLRGLFAPPEGQDSAYRMAGGMDPNLASLVDSTMAGEPFDAAQEAAAKRHSWR